MLTTISLQRQKYHMQLGEASLPVSMVKVFLIGDVRAGKSTIKRSLTQVSYYFESNAIVRTCCLSYVSSKEIIENNNIWCGELMQVKNYHNFLKKKM